MSHSSPDEAHGRSGRRTALALPRRHELAAEGLAAMPSVEPAEESLQLRDLMRIFLKRKWTILAIFAISALLSVVLTYLAPPVYRASTTIQIERFAPQVMNFKDVSPVETYDYDSGDFYYTNYELLKSRTLAERAAEDMGLRKNHPAPGADATPKASEEKQDGNSLHAFLNRLRGALMQHLALLYEYRVIGYILRERMLKRIRRLWKRHLFVDEFSGLETREKSQQFIFG